MKLRLLPKLIVLLALSCTTVPVAAAAAIPARHTAAPKTPITSDAPLALFQSVDKRLTLLDADDQKLQLSMDQIHSVRGVARRTRMLRQLQHSSPQQERLRIVNQLLAISSTAERRYRNQRQAYGSTLFRDFGAKVSSVRTALLRVQTAPTTGAWAQEEKLVNTRLLSVIRQFQAISGGYVPLACHPGSWACCQPRTVRDGEVSVRGCTWSCTSKLATCRGGCLGRQTPTNVVAVKNTPKPPIFAQSPTLSSRQTAKTKAKARVNAAAVARGSASGQ